MSLAYDSGQAEFQQSFVGNPIFLTGGVAGNAPGGTAPMSNYIQGQGLFGGSSNSSTSTSTAGGASGGTSLTNSALSPSAGGTYTVQWDPSPGAELTHWEYAKFPFANQQTAANAAVKQPLRFSICLIYPWQNPGDAFAKQAVMTALQSTLDQHIGQGGTFTVAFLSVVYTNALLITVRDVTQNERQNERQTTWEFTFELPLVTLQQAQAAQNSLMQKITNGTPIGGDPPSYSGPGAAVGNPASGQATALVPNASTSAGGAAGQAGVPAATPPPTGGG